MGNSNRKRASSTSASSSGIAKNNSLSQAACSSNRANVSSRSMSASNLLDNSVNCNTAASNNNQLNSPLPLFKNFQVILRAC